LIKNSIDLKGRNFPLKGKMLRRSVEKEVVRRMGGEKWKIGVRLVKFTLSNVVWIENTLFPLFELLFSIDDKSFLFHDDPFNGDVILVGIIGPRFCCSYGCSVLCCEKRKRFFWKIVSLSLVSRLHFTRELGINVAREMFECGK
jgi:hypothetical protein